MSQRERQRYHLLKMVIGGRTTLKEASRVMGVSYRQAKRLKMSQSGVAYAIGRGERIVKDNNF